jgi:hypothetical protein
MSTCYINTPSVAYTVLFCLLKIAAFWRKIYSLKTLCATRINIIHNIQLPMWTSVLNKWENLRDLSPHFTDLLQNNILKGSCGH